VGSTTSAAHRTLVAKTRLIDASDGQGRLWTTMIPDERTSRVAREQP
jgi:hypothetical protein